VDRVKGHVLQPGDRIVLGGYLDTSRTRPADQACELEFSPICTYEIGSTLDDTSRR